MGRNVDKRREARILVVWNYSGEGQLFSGAGKMEGSGRSRRCSERSTQEGFTYTESLIIFHSGQ